MRRKGIILAGGTGSRLGELTRVMNKHLLPVGDSPMVCHAVNKMAGAGVRDVLLLSGPEHLGAFAQLFGSGRRHGVRLLYQAQDEAAGIAHALGLASAFAAGAPCVVLLADNIFLDPLAPLLDESAQAPEHAWAVLKRVPDPERYGVAEMQAGRIVGLEEKPVRPTGDCAVLGIYLYPPDVFEVIGELRPSPRGELEITDVNRHYLQQGRLGHHFLPGYWTDAGTPESLALANQLVRDCPPRFS